MEEDRPSSNLSFTADEVVKNALDKARQAIMLEEHAPEYMLKNVNWVTCKDFTVEVGKKQIAEYIRTWEVRPSWLFSLDFLRTTEEEHHTVHHYRSRWSSPTPRTPVPRRTASVYFTVDISKVKAQTSPVQVYFTVESNRTVHTAGKTRFRERWLEDVVESKALLHNTVDF